MSTALKIIVDDFADFHDMQRVQRDAHGIYTIVFDQRWVLNIEADPVSHSVCVFASAGSLRPSLERPSEMPEVEWHALTAEQLPFGVRIGVHFSTGTVMLDSQADPAQLDTVAFRQWLMGFIDQLQLWSKHITPRSRAEHLLQAVRSRSQAPHLQDLHTTSQGSET